MSSSSPLNPVRDEYGIFWTGSDFLVFGGLDWNGNYYGDGARYNPTTNAWTSITPLASNNTGAAVRWDSTQVWTGSQLVVWGGWGTAPGGAVYTLSSDSWTPMSTVGAPTNNIAYAAGAFANGNVYIWGGNTPTYSGCGAGGGVNTGGIYNVATDSWTSMSTVNAPAGRSYFATASSATQLFVWGGTDDHCPWNWYVAASPLDTVFNTGGVYTFATDQWTPMSTVNAPSARVIPSGVWTGSKFVVWGGYPDPITSPCTPGGAMYDPTSDTWTTISTVGAPSLCRGALVWTGSRVIVRDGQLSDEKTYINKGYIFNPETNTWEGEMTTVNQPSVFGMSLGLAYGNSNPWNGSQLFVWGNSGNTSVNSAYLYSP